MIIYDGDLADLTVFGYGFPISRVHWRLLVLLWNEALMSFYELYSANIPLLIPSAEWMYRLLYMRGQLSVGERALVTVGFEVFDGFRWAIHV